MRIPSSTYRLQLGSDLGFAAATGLVPHLRALGVGDVYLSPCLAARPGSAHGYDVADCARLNPAIGDEAAFRGLARALAEHDMGLVLDVVPNHMAASPHNPWWRDVLRHGPSARCAEHFDIDWRPPWPGVDDRVMLPVLGEHYGAALAAGRLRIAWSEADGELVVRYYDHAIPLDPGTCAAVVGEGLGDLEAELGAGHPLVQGLRGVARALGDLPPPAARDGTRGERATAALRALADLIAAEPGARAHLDRNLRRLDPTAEAGRARLDGLLAAQPWRLCYWKSAVREINYRRFFNISDLVGLRVEDPAVRDESHALVLRLWRDGLLTGLRIDHVDGLYDPAGYLRWLAEQLGRQGWIVVEKILAPEEDLPDWPVAGTTGYDFLNVVNGVHVDARGLEHLDEIYSRFTGRDTPFPRLVYEKQRAVIGWLFQGELRRLERDLALLARRDRDACDVAASELGRALVEVTASLPVYRTYLRAEEAVPAETRRIIEGAVNDARRRDRDSDDAAYAFLCRVLLLDVAEPLRAEALRFVQRWQQFTPPVRAKGLEDTSLYVYNRLISTNDVGAEPDQADVSLADFHRFNVRRQARWRAALSASATHDTKRGEDVRARINVLSEVPAEWEARLQRWAELNAPHRVDRGGPVPDPNEEMLLYQTLIGAWPLDERDVPSFRERLRAFLVKSAREAHEFTSWHDPDEAREQALLAFAERILEPRADNEFLSDFEEFQNRVALLGAVNGLSQLLLKLAAPGVPDLYQGTELWSFSLVDPDNRRPVDHDLRYRLLSAIREAGVRPDVVAGYLDGWRDGRIKLYTTWRLLQHRRAHPALYAEGCYTPLYVDGPRRRHCCAFARRRAGQWLIAGTTRMATSLAAPGRWPLGAEAWGDACLALPREAPARWQDVLTGAEHEAPADGDRRVLPAAAVFGVLPVALLEAVREAADG